MMMLQMWMLKAKMKLNAFFRKENGDVNIVSIVVLIAIALILAVFFRKNIEAIVTKLFKGINEHVDDVNKNMS